MDINFDLDKLIAAAIPLIKTYALKLAAAILIFLIGKWIARKITTLLTKVLEKNNIDVTLIRFLENIVYYALLIVVLVAAAGQLGINITSFIAILGAAGLAVGLALKDSLSNFASGVMLVLFRPYRIGDAINTAGIVGKVEGISLFNTTLNTPDNQRVIIPNSSITSNVITNITANDTRRVDLVIGISYDDDIKKAKEILARIIEAESRVLDNPTPTIAVLALADSSVNFAVRPWVNTKDYWDVYFDLTETIKLEFDKENITIPYPQRDVHLYNEKPA